MSFVTTDDGTEIFYKDWGSGQPIMFHHGWPLSSDDWDAQMMFFLQHGYRVIAHDRRGHGRSTPDVGRARHGHLRRRCRRRGRAPRPARRRARRALDRRRRGRPLRRPARRRPGGQGGADQRGPAADAEDRRQPRRPADRGVRRLPRGHRVQPGAVLPRRRRPGRSTGSTGPAPRSSRGRHPELVAPGDDGRRQGPLRGHQGVLGDRLQPRTSRRSTSRPW